MARAFDCREDPSSSVLATEDVVTGLVAIEMSGDDCILLSPDDARAFAKEILREAAQADMRDPATSTRSEDG